MKPQKIYPSSEVIFFDKFNKDERVCYGRNQVKHLRYCLFARGYHVDDIATKMELLSTQGYLSPDEVKYGEDTSAYWVLAKALPKELRGQGNNWEAIKEYLHIEEK